MAASPPAISVVEAEAEANFDFRCVVKHQDAKAAVTPAAVLLGYQTGAPHLAVTLSHDALTLNRVANDRRTIIATANQYYAVPTDKGTPLVVQWRDGSVRVIYDGRTVLRQEKLGALKGRIAVSSRKGNLEFIEPAVQPVEPVNFADDFMRSATVPGLWETATGTWKLNTSGDPNLGANPFSYIASGKPAMSLAGRWFWNDYTASVSVRPSGAGAVGLIVYWQDDKNYLMCRWYAADGPSAPNTKKQLWRVVRGEPMLIAAAPGGWHPNQWYRLSMTAANGTIKMQVDGNTTLEKRTDLFGQGKMGLFANADAEAMFDDVQVQAADAAPTPEVDRLATGPARFANDASMEEWSQPKGQWLPTTTTPITFWNRGMFFGNYAVGVKATNIAVAGAKVHALLCGDGTTPESGYALQVKPTADNKSIESVLLRGGKPVTAPNVTLLADPAACQIKLQRTGNLIQGLVGKTVVASFTDPKPLNGRRAGYVAETAQIAFSDAHVTGGNMVDYTFYKAPTDWQVTSGTWDLASRWICTPTWSWYAGWSDRVAAVWNKRNFTGDFAIEVFAASKMDSPQAPYYLHPRDLNITVAGDGRDPSSGYSCIFGGWNNTFTRILRGTQTVAETNQVLLPAVGTYHAVAHHKWFSLRVEKTGDTISYYIDRKLALQYKDSKPLEGRRIALWTSGNGIMIARATIYYEKEGATELVPGVLTVGNDLPAAPVEKLNWQVRGADPAVALTAVAAVKPGERPAVRAFNRGGGGNFAITPQMEPFDALKTPKLTFQSRMETGTEINLYLRVKGIYHAVRLTGPGPNEDQADVKSLGTAKVAADGKWHDVELDLAALLKTLYPADTQLMVDEIFLGNLARDSYRQAGFGANYPGTNYLVRYFALRSAENKLAKLVEPQLPAPPKTVAARPPVAAQPKPKPGL